MIAKKLLPFFLVLLLFFGMIGQNVTLFMVDKVSEIGTVEMSAVVSKVSHKVTEDGTTWTIYVKEPEGELWIRSSVGDTLDASIMETLQPGNTGVFRMDLATAEQYRTIGNGHIVALKADQEIFSMSEYNAIMHHAVLPARIVCLSLQVILLLLLIYLGRKNKVFDLFRGRKSKI